MSMPNVSTRSRADFRLKVRKLYESAGEKKLDQVLRTLSPREGKLIRLRWQGQSHERIGRQLALSETRVRNIEREIYRKLCQESRLRMVDVKGNLLENFIESQDFLSVRG